MKVLILAGGFGTRLGEETDAIPKPMVLIGDRPILWHILKIYSHYGFNEFVILLGYKASIIKQYFANYYLENSNITIDLKNNHIEYHQTNSEPWNISLLDTGLNTLTGSRVKRAQKFVGNEPFMLTYGDGVANIDILELIKTHKAHGKTMTLTAVQPEGRFGRVKIENSGKISSFVEKPGGDGGWINGGFFVCEPQIFDYLGSGDQVSLEKKPLYNLAKNNELCAYRHSGFWRCMDTLREKNELVEMWEQGSAPWKF